MGYHVRFYECKEDFFPYASAVCHGGKNIYNAGNYYIRNTMTALSKEEKDRFPQEKEILSVIKESVKKQNILKSSKFSNELWKVFLKEEKEPFQAMMDKIDKAHDFREPTKDSWFLDYVMLDLIFKQSENPDYNYMHKQYVQNALRKLVGAWDGYFSSLKEYQKNPNAFTGKPKIPKYKKVQEIPVRISGQYLTFKETPKGTLLLFPFQEIDEKKVRGQILINNLPDEKIAVAEIQPYYGKYRLILTFGKAEEKDISNHQPVNIMGLDPGVKNFAAITDNTGGNPVIIKGGFLKARNQYFNKRKAELLSKLTKGKDSKHSKKHSKKLYALSRKRENFFRDCFYKISHRICKLVKARNIDTLVIGKNTYWKQNTHMGKKNNQEFVSIPFLKFYQILEYVASQYDIITYYQDESYTSKASFLDNDDIPTYKEGVSQKYIFSGKRRNRGLYFSKDRTSLNADVNGSANIIRKFKSDAFANVKKETVLQKIDVYTFKDFYPERKVV